MAYQYLGVKNLRISHKTIVTLKSYLQVPPDSIEQHNRKPPTMCHMAVYGANHNHGS